MLSQKHNANHASRIGTLAMSTAHEGTSYEMIRQKTRSTSSPFLISSLSRTLHQEGPTTRSQVARGMGSPRQACNRRRRTREGPEPACVQTPLSVGVAHAGGKG